MNFTLRQWAIIVALAAAFIVAAIVVSNNSGSAPTADGPVDFDEVVWCEAANAISRWSSILDGSADGDSIDDVRNLRQALTAARPAASAELSFELARLMDYTLLVEQGDEREGDLAAGLAGAQGNVDTERVAEAIAAVDAAIVACGHPPVTG